MKKLNGLYTVYGNPVKASHSRAADRWQRMFVKKFSYEPAEKYKLKIEDNPHLGEVFGMKNILRVEGVKDKEFAMDAAGPVPADPKGIIISTIRMGFGHYRIVIAGASAPRAMGFTPYWLDLLSIPGITSDVINWCNTWYSRWSRISQNSSFFNKYVWEPVTTGEPTLPLRPGPSRTPCKPSIS